MIEREDIIRAVNEELAGRDELFCVDVAVRGDEAEVTIDSDGRVSVDDCATLTRAVESHFDREEEDFALTVSSAGIGRPFTMLRQYRKRVGREVEVVMRSGAKLTATLDAVNAAEGADDMDGATVTLSYPKKQRAEGDRRPRLVTVTETFPLAELKSTCEHIDFK